MACQPSPERHEEEEEVKNEVRALWGTGGYDELYCRKSISSGDVRVHLLSTWPRMFLSIDCFLDDTLIPCIPEHMPYLEFPRSYLGSKHQSLALLALIPLGIPLLCFFFTLRWHILKCLPPPEINLHAIFKWTFVNLLSFTANLLLPSTW